MLSAMTDLRGTPDGSACFWLVFDRTSNPVVLLDEQRCIVDVNRAALELWGVTRRELVGTSMVDSIRPSERELAEAEWKAFLESGEYSGARDLVRPDGSEVHVAFAASLGVVGGQRLAIYVAMADESGQEHPAGPGELPLTSREREIVTLIALGRETADIAAELHISAETVRSHVRNAMGKLELTRVRSWWRRRSAAAMPSTRARSGPEDKSSVRGIEGRPGGSHHSQVPLRIPWLRRRPSDGDLLDALMETMDVAVIACAADGRMTHSNERARHLMGPKCALGTYPDSWMRDLQPRTASGVPMMLADLPAVRALAGEIVRGVDLLVRLAGADVLLETVARPAGSEHGRPAGAIMTMRDVTQVRRREALLRSRLLRGEGAHGSRRLCSEEEG